MRHCWTCLKQVVGLLVVQVGLVLVGMLASPHLLVLLVKFFPFSSGQMSAGCGLVLVPGKKKHTHIFTKLLAHIAFDTSLP